MINIVFPCSSPAVQPLTDQSGPDLEEMMDMDVADLLNIQIITVSKELEDSFLAPGTIYVITEDEILRNGWRFLQDALKSVPSVYLYDPHSWVWGGQRGFVSNFSQTLLMINGREVNNLVASEGFISRQFATYNIKQIEVMASPGSALYGANALAGIINIITKESDPNYTGLETGLNYGSFNSGSTSFTFAHSIKDFRFRGSGMFFRSDEEDYSSFVRDTNDFSRGWEDNQLANKSIDDYENPSKSLPLNFQVDYKDIYAGVNYYYNRQSQGLEKLSWDYTEGEDHREFALFYGGINKEIREDMKIKLEYQHTKSWFWGRYYPGLWPASRLQTSDSVNVFTWAPDDIVDPNVSFAQNLINNGYIDPDNITEEDIEKYFTHIYSNKNSDGSTRQRVDLQFDWQINDKIGLISGYTYDRLDYIGLAVTDAATGEGASFDVPLDTSKREDVYDSFKHGWFAQIKDEIFDDKLWGTLGVRYDHQNFYGGTINPRAALVWQPLKGSILKFMYGQAFREPNVFELSSDPGVQPAKLISYETSYSQQLGKMVRFFCTSYYNKVSDFLGSVGSIIGTGVGQVEEQRVMGTEFRIDAKYKDWHSFINGSIILDAEQDIVDEQTGGKSTQDLLSISRNRINTGITYNFYDNYAFSLLHSFTGSYEALSGNPNVTNTFRIGSANEVNATLSMDSVRVFDHDLSGYFTITNLTDSEIYHANIRGSGPHKFLQDGRAFYFGITSKW